MREKSDPPAAELPGRVLYEDNHLLVVAKQAGELTQADAGGEESLLDLCREYIRVSRQKPGNVFLGLVHRLDRPVSGVIAFALTSKAASRLCDQFRRRTTRKLYLAVAEGAPPAESGRLEHVLTGDRARRKSFVAPVGAKSRKPQSTEDDDETGSDGKLARLQYRVLRRAGGRTLLEVELLTGYKHQIRAQLAAIGCPLVGDFKYDHRQKPAVTQPLADGRAVALHAWSLSFTHPTRAEELTFTAPCPDYWPLSPAD